MTGTNDEWHYTADASGTIDPAKVHDVGASTCLFSSRLSPLGQLMVFLVFFAILTGAFLTALYFYYRVK
jgi:hypothetical protein